MAFASVDPAWINASADAPSYNAVELRQIDAGLFLGTTPGQMLSGVRPGNDLKVSLSGSTITVQAGSFAVQGTTTSGQGVYRGTFPSAQTESLTPADPTFARIDALWVRVQDHEVDGSNQRRAIVEYAAGVPSGTPEHPALPASAVLLATITVPAAGSGSPAVVDKRTHCVAAGGALPASGRPSTPYAGLMIYRLDTGDVETWNGTVWVTKPLVRPSARIRQTVGQQFTSAQFGTLNMDQVSFDSGGVADLAGDRLIATRAGGYTALARVAFAANAVGYRRADLMLNGAIYAVDGKDANTTSGLATQVVITETLRLNTGDFIQVRGFHTSNGPLSSVAAGDYYSMLSLTYQTPTAITPLP